MKSRLALLCMAGIAVVLSSCTSPDERIVAQVGEYEITVGTIKDEYLAISKHARPMLSTLEEKEAFARDIVAKEIIRLEAEKAGFGDLPDVLRAREAMVQNKAWQTFYEEEIRGNVDISEDEMRALYDRQTYSYHLAWIFTRSKAMAEEALAKIEAGRPFGEIAGIYSIDPSRARGGDLGMRPLGNMPPDVESKIEAMSPGEVSGVLVYEDYYAILKLLDKQEREQMDFESSIVGLESTLMTKKITARQRELAAGYREKYQATYDDDVIELIAARSRAANPREDSPPGGLPEFSDEELQLVAASYDGEEWTVAEYLERTASMRDFARPSYGADAEFIRSLLRDYMTGELWVLEAMNLGYGERDDVVSAADREYERAMVTAFHDSLVKDVTVGEDDLKEFYDEYREQLMSEPLYNLAIIVVKTKAEAEDVYNELKGGASFAGLARARSIDLRTKDRGGEIRETFLGRSLEQFPEVYEAVIEMDVGEFAEPMLLPPTWGPEGYMVMKLLKREEARQLEYDEVESMLGQRVLELEQDKVFGAWLAERTEEEEVILNPDALAAIDFSAL